MRIWRAGAIQTVTLLAFVAAVTPYTAAASPILLTGGESFTVTFDGVVGGKSVNGLSASATFEFLGLFDADADGNSEAQLLVTLLNTSADSLTTSRLTAIGFDVNADVTGGSVSGSFEKVLFGSEPPEGLGTVDVCITSNNCGGNGGKGLLGEDAGTFVLTLLLNGWFDSIALDNFGARYRGISGGTLHNENGIGRGTAVLTHAGASGVPSGQGSQQFPATGGPRFQSGQQPVTVAAPEPGTLMLLGSGLALSARAIRRRKRTD